MRRREFLKLAFAAAACLAAPVPRLPKAARDIDEVSPFDERTYSNLPSSRAPSAQRLRDAMKLMGAPTGFIPRRTVVPVHLAEAIKKVRGHLDKEGVKHVQNLLTRPGSWNG